MINLIIIKYLLNTHFEYRFHLHEQLFRSNSSCPIKFDVLKPTIYYCGFKLHSTILVSQ